MHIFFMDPKDWRTYPNAQRFEAGLDAVCAVDREMTVGTLSTFVRVARRIPALTVGALSLRSIAEEMNLGYSSFLRQTDCLAAGGPSVRSLDLLEKVIRPDDRRARDVLLTERGKALMESITACMETPLSQPEMALIAPQPSSDGDDPSNPKPRRSKKPKT
jgi:DNA-binding MarR family transcriptional regulator